MLFPELKELIKLKNVIGAANVTQQRSSSRSHGDYASLFHGLGMEFETVRPYVVGDDVRYIDWRVTARSGKPQVKTFRAECDRNVFLVIDANAYMRFGTRSTFKSVQVARIAALLGWKSLQQQDRVGGIIYGDIPKGLQYFKPAKTDTIVLRMLRLLCDTNINVHQPVATEVALHHVSRVASPQSLVFVVSDFSIGNIKDIERSLVTLRKKCTVVLLSVFDQADREIPPIGPLEADYNTLKVLINTSDKQARTKYINAWETYQKSLTELCKKIKAPLMWVDTVMDPVRAIFWKT
jgi:uncharacterized protein (DUF58 family)